MAGLATAGECMTEDNISGDANGESVTIKKYANRRLYNTATSSYVTLDHLCQMVKDGTEFVVRDAKTGEDITHQVLTQIIVEEESKGQSLLPMVASPNDPTALGLLDTNPFPDTPPRLIRFAMYRYHFTTPDEGLDGDWWRRDFIGYLTEPISGRP